MEGSSHAKYQLDLLSCLDKTPTVTDSHTDIQSKYRHRATASTRTNIASRR